MLWEHSITEERHALQGLVVLLAPLFARACVRACFLGAPLWGLLEPSLQMVGIPCCVPSNSVFLGQASGTRQSILDCLTAAARGPDAIGRSS